MDNRMGEMGTGLLCRFLDTRFLKELNIWFRV